MRLIIVGAMLASMGQLACAHPLQIVEIKTLAYTLAEVTLHVGDTLEWVNKDPIIHTLTVKAGTAGGPWEIIIEPSKSIKRQMNDVGIVEYYCRFHPNMKGRIIVLAK